MHENWKLEHNDYLGKKQTSSSFVLFISVTFLFWGETSPPQLLAVCEVKPDNLHVYRLGWVALSVNDMLICRRVLVIKLQ